MRYMRYTAYVCMFGRRGKGAEISLMGVRFFEIVIPLLTADGERQLRSEAGTARWNDFWSHLGRQHRRLKRCSRAILGLGPQLAVAPRCA